MKKKLISLYSKLCNRETMAYLVFGVLTTLLSFAIYEGLCALGYAATLASLLGNAVAIVFAFVTNKLWVFQAPSWKTPVLWAELSKFVSGRLFTTALEAALVFTFVDCLNQDKTVVKLVATVFVVVANYFLSKWFVFK